MKEDTWQTTFIDMLMLMLTFFVFIIAISSFRIVTGELPKVLKADINQGLEKNDQNLFNKGTALELIKGLKVPRMPLNAQFLLSELAQAAQSGTYKGADLFYNENKISLIFPDSITFTPGLSNLDNAVKVMIADLSKKLSVTSFQISIEGHTDDQQSDKIDNLDLSTKRSLQVAKIMVESGVAPNRLIVSGYGPYRPVTNNKDPSTRWLNRRVEIHIMLNEGIL